MRKNFKQVNKDLNLEYTSDWGIINANSIRAKEFILYYNDNFLEDSVKFEFIDLICSSVNESLLKNKVDYELRLLFSEYIYGIEKTELNSLILATWLTCDEEFPVGCLIQEILANETP